MTLPRGSQESGAEQQASAELRTFVTSPALDELAELFVTDMLPDDPSERLSDLQVIAAEHWDFRKGAERQATDWNDELLDQEGSEQWDAVFKDADQLGLVQDTEPIVTNPDFLLILGGANRAPYDRLRYGLEKTTGSGAIAYLGSSRMVSDAEREKAADYAPEAQTEFDLGCGAVETLLGASEFEEHRIERGGDTWIARVYTYTDADETRHAYVLSTPQMIGEKRATTYDNYRFFAEAAELSEHTGATIVSVTTGFYTAGQHLPGIQELTLPFGAHLETIGHSAEYSGAKRKPSQLLQETKAAIDAAVRLDTVLSQKK